MKASRIAAVGIVAAAGLWIASGHFLPHESAASRASVRSDTAAKKPFRVAVIEAKVVDHARKLVLAGRTEADRRVTVAARSGGVLTELRVRRGARVKEGDIIAVLSDDARKAQVAQAESLVIQRRTELEAKRKLIASGAVPKLELVNLEAQLAAAEATLAAAHAELERALVRAPFGGIVNDVTVEVGGAALPMMGREIATIVALDPMLAVVEVSERRLAGLRVGDTAEVKLITGEKVSGKIRFVAKTASQTTRTYRVEVELPNRDGSIPDGISAEVAIPVAADAGGAGAAFRADHRIDRRHRRAHGRRGRNRRLQPRQHCRRRAELHVDRRCPRRRTGDRAGPGFRPRRPDRRGGRGGGDHRHGEIVHRLRAGGGAKKDFRMSRFIDYAISHARLTIATLVFLLVAGAVAYVTIPKEAEPDVRIPIIFVQLTQRGISPEDSERLLLRPVETQLKSVGNVKEMRSTAYEGGGYVLLEFEAGFDAKAALADVRAKVDNAKHDLPRDVDEPQVTEVNLSLYPVLVVGLSGDVPERTLLRIARSAKNAIEQAPGVLSAELRGARDEAVEIIIDPMQMRSYGISLDTLGQITQSFNTLIAAGALEGQSGRFSVKVPSLFERPQDILKVPLVASQNASVTLSDIAQIKPTFKDAISITRVNGRPAMTIEVSKRTGANLIEVVDAVKYIVTQMQRTWPESVHVTFTQDKSKVIRQMLGDLQNSVATGVILVAVIILFALGFRASLFIGIAIPASFLAGVLGLQLAGLTVNIVVLFSLILAVGMLVDDAIIVSEFAERRMAEGMPPKEAYSLAAKRMSGPVIAATLTRIAAFSPLLFWPGVVGQFMKYLPITLIATLSASLVVALFFTPTLGALLGKARAGQA